MASRNPPSQRTLPHATTHTAGESERQVGGRSGRQKWNETQGEVESLPEVPAPARRDGPVSKVIIFAKPMAIGQKDPGGGVVAAV